MTNPARNEVEIEFEGRAYVCRPDFRTVAAIEQAGGKSILYLGEDVSAYRSPFMVIAAILRLALLTSPEGRAEFAKLTPDKVGERLMDQEGGPAGVFAQLGMFCLRALSGPPSKEAEAAPAGEAGPPPT